MSSNIATEDLGKQEALSESVEASRQITLTLKTLPDAEGLGIRLQLAIERAAK